MRRVCPVKSPCSVFRPQQKTAYISTGTLRRPVLIINVHKQRNVYKERLGAIWFPFSPYFRTPVIVLDCNSFMSTPSPPNPTRLDPNVVAALGTTSTRNSSDSSLNRVKNLPGYTTPIFKGKKEQRALVENNVAAKVTITYLPLVPRTNMIGLVSGLYSQGARPRGGQLVLHQSWYRRHLFPERRTLCHF